jgi:hypothetical protein
VQDRRRRLPFHLSFLIFLYFVSSLPMAIRQS